MAKIRLRGSHETVEGEEQVRAFLNRQGVLYEHWDIQKLPGHLQENFELDEDDKAEILRSFDADIRDLAKRRGYLKWDVIALSENTPNLEEMLKKFEQVHTHSEDEVRAIVGGHGIFIIKGQDDAGYFDVEMGAGDVISVPENTPHFFTLMDDRQVVAIRLFIDPSGWVAHPYNDPDLQNSSV